MFFSTTSVSTLLRVLAASAASIPFVAAQLTTDDLYGALSSTAAPSPGFNAGGGSVFTNYVNAFNDGQLFTLYTGSFLYEMPGSEPFVGSTFTWCSDLTFSDFSNSSLMGYAGRCVEMFLAGYADIVAAGGELTFEYSEGEFTHTLGLSAVYVEQLNVFEGHHHSNTDDYVYRYWDDGRKISPTIGWEGHDEGDMHPNAATSAGSDFGDNTWMSVKEVAQLFNTSTDEFTPEKFKQVYMDTWTKQHEKEAAENNPNPESELEIIEEVKNETDSTGETASSAEPDMMEDGGNDASDPAEEDSASGRKLASVAARFVSAALRVFGI